MRILVIGNLYPPEVLGGYEILCEQVCLELAERGHDIRVLTTGEDRSKDNVIRDLELYLPFSRPARKDRIKSFLAYRKNYRKTRRTILDYQPDVIFCWSQLRLTLGAMRAAQLSRRPVLYTVNDEHISGYLPSARGRTIRSIIGWLLDQTLFRHLTLLSYPLPASTTISRKVEENLARQGVRLPQNRTIYQGIPIAQFPVKDQPGYLHHPVRILYVGQLNPYKGVHRVIEAVGGLKAPASLSVVGDGPEDYKAELRLLSEDIDVTFHGRVPHQKLPELYRRHDIFVFSSIWEEPFGLTHLEAMASGLPVVSTVNGGQGEFLSHEENCLAILPDDSQSLRTALERLCEQPDLAEKIARAGRSTVETRFTTDRYIDELEELLEELVRQ